MSSVSISESLHRLVNAYKSHMYRVVQREQLGLPITHLRVLKAVCRKPSCTAQSIARRMQRDKAQITRVLHELSGDGLIEKRENPEDRRSQLLFPTARGRDVIERLSAIERQIAALMTKNLTAQDVDMFIRLAAAMAKNLGGGPEAS